MKQLWDERVAKRKSEQEKPEEREDRKRMRSENVYVTVVEKCGGYGCHRMRCMKDCKGRVRRSAQKCCKHSFKQGDMCSVRRMFKEG